MFRRKNREKKYVECFAVNFRKTKSTKVSLLDYVILSNRQSKILDHRFIYILRNIQNPPRLNSLRNGVSKELLQRNKIQFQCRGHSSKLRKSEDIAISTRTLILGGSGFTFATGLYARNFFVKCEGNRLSGALLFSDLMNEI